MEFGFGSNIHYSFKDIKYQDIWNYVTKRSDDSSPTFIPARERTQLSLYWADWTGVVYIRASLNCTKREKWKIHDSRQTSGENTEKNVISFRWKSHQKEHAWLHDLPGQLHQSALLQEHLWRQTVLFVFFRSNPLLIKHFRCSVEPPELTLPGWTISWWPFRLYWICISFWKLSWKKTNPTKVRPLRHWWYQALDFEWWPNLTPCFMMSLAWLATSFTMLRAAVLGDEEKLNVSFLWQTLHTITLRVWSDGFTLCVLIILRVFWKVLQIIWRKTRDFNHAQTRAEQRDQRYSSQVINWLMTCGPKCGMWPTFDCIVKLV